MKRLLYGTGVAFMLIAFASCTQHDTKSPDTSGSLPTTQPGAGIDTVGAANSTMQGGNTGTNNNNDQTNNNGSVNTGDSASSNH